MIKEAYYVFSEIYQSLKPILPVSEIHVVRSIVAPGDVIVLRSEYFERLVPGYWSHAAVYVGGIHGTHYAVQARAYGVQRISLKRLFRTKYIAILRPKVPSPTRRAAARRAISMCGQKYDLLFDFEDNSKLSCVELPYVLYKEALRLSTKPISILGVEKEVFLPDDLFNKHFEIRWISRGATNPLSAQK